MSKSKKSGLGKFLLGAGIGVGLGILFAPKSGKETKLLFIMAYPNILKELIKGKILYIDNYTGYLGHKEIKGPYGEEEIFIPEYTSNNISLIEIIIDIENKIKNNKKKIRK